MEFFNQFLKSPILISIDILVVSYIIFVLIYVARQSQAASVLKGIALVVLVKMVSQTLQLHALNWIIDQVITWGVIAVMIIFQPEIRRYLEQLGQNSFLQSKKKELNNMPVDDILEATQYLSKRYIGALICIENKSSLQTYINTGVLLRAQLSSQLLINMFTPNTPLHDGAVIIRDDSIVAASCVLPLSENTSIPQELGTRHRAAIGLSETTDALVIIISEETGDISVAHRHELYRQFTVEQLAELLTQTLYQPQQTAKTFPEKVKAILVKFGGRQNG